MTRSTDNLELISSRPVSPPTFVGEDDADGGSRFEDE